MASEKNNVAAPSAVGDEAFNVTFLSEVDDNTMVVTTQESFEEKMDSFYRDDMMSAVAEMRKRGGYAVAAFNPDSSLYSVYPNKTESSSDIDTNLIDTYAENANTDLATVISIASLIRKYSNKDCLVSVAYDAVNKSCNTEYKNVFANYDNQRNKSKAVEKAKAIIEDFDTQIDVKRLIRSAVSGAWMEGNYIMLLRDGGGNYAVDFLPLGIAEISDYQENGQPVVLVNMSKLKSALQKSMKTNSKRKPLFFKNTLEEVMNNYPKEVVDAYKSNDNYARLPTAICQVIRVHNKGFRYGCPPAFAAMEHILQIEQYTKSDRLTSKARMKKIVWQKLSSDLMGPEKNRDGYTQMAYAHNNLLRSWAAGNNVLVTTPPYVEDLRIVEAENGLTNTDNLKWEMQLACMPLGIYFYNLDGAQGSTGISMSLKQMYLTIDNIAEQVARSLRVFHRYVLKQNGITEEEMVPTTIIGKADMMGSDSKRSLSAYLYNTLGCSRQTSMELVGIDINDELQRRKEENDKKYDDVFAPRITAFTASGNGSSGSNGGGSSSGGSGGGGSGSRNTTGYETNENLGRKRTNEDKDKQEYDRQRYQDMKDSR